MTPRERIAVAMWVGRMLERAARAGYERRALVVALGAGVARLAREHITRDEWSRLWEVADGST